MTVAFQGKYFMLYLGNTIHFVANIRHYFFQGTNSWCLIVPVQEKYSVEWVVKRTSHLASLH